MDEFIYLDLAPLLTALFAAASAAVLGSILLLRRSSLMGDAISHSVLPGIVIAFLVSGSRSALPVFFGALCAGVLAAVLIELVRRLGRLSVDTSMGVVFSIFFALGVLLIEVASGRSVDLDADCLLHGQLETLIWIPRSREDVFSWSGLLTSLPLPVYNSAAVFLLVIFVVSVFYKEIKLFCFDQEFAHLMGMRVSLAYYLLMILVAFAVVASFQAVGSILVIAMIICPAASARLWTDRFSRQIFFALLFSVLSVLVGYAAASWVPAMLGYQYSLNAAGMIALTSGLLLTLSVLFAPQYGVMGKILRARRLVLQVTMEDVIGLLYRLEEMTAAGVAEVGRGAAAADLRAVLPGVSNLPAALELGLSLGLLVCQAGHYKLTEAGRASAATLLRSHRLWERYMVDIMGLSPDHVHVTATALEHFTSPDLVSALSEGQDFPGEDPHGREIP
ncbi:MAG: iron chelate uptake ABC transporter family permease subunit [bacterium]|nr:iron chelate uptake ABC transporter family permease subunit [bacterium]